MIAEDGRGSRSPSASDTSDDAYNKDTARVYFGPLKTPEKRFASIVAIPDSKLQSANPSPSQDAPGQSVRKSRSPSISSSTVSEDMVDVERLVGLDEEKRDGTRSTDVGTPQASSLPNDEPSSALARRLLRALDNPSPPPSPRHLPLEDDADEVDPDGDEIGPAREGQGVPIAPIFFPATTASQATPPRSSDQASNILEPDLMTFDSFDDRLEVPTSLLALPTDLSQSPPSPFSFPNTTVLEPNEITHVPKLPQEHSAVLIDVEDEAPETSTTPPIDCVSTEHTDDQVTAHLVGTYPAAQTSGFVSTSSTPLAPVVHSPGWEGADEFIPEEIPHTPLRRSSRPRKSTTPHIIKFLAVNSPGIDKYSPRASTPRSGVQTRKSRKGKERAGSPFKSITDNDTENVHALDPDLPNLDEKQSEPKAYRRYSRSPIRQEFARGLGSLSPNSTDLLSRLVPSVPAASSEPASLPTTECSGQIQVPEPLPTPSTSQITQNTSISQPVEESPNGPVDNLSPLRVPATPRRPRTPQSPLRLPLQSTSSDKPSHTPARRIPIEQAVAEGRISPQKFAQMQTGTPAPISIFSGQPMPVLNMSLKGDQSPARRVLVGPSALTAGSSKMPSHREDSTKGNFRLGELSVDGSSTQAAVPISPKATTTERSAKLPFPLVPTSKVQPSTKKDAGDSVEPSNLSSPGKSSLKQTASRIPRKKPYSRPKPNGTVEKKSVRKAVPLRAVDLTKGTAEANNSTKSAVKPKTSTRVQVESTSNVRVIRAVELSKPPPNASDFSSSPDVETLSSGINLNDNDASAVGNLKRKRPDSKVTPVSSSRLTRVSRQIPPVARSSDSNVMRPTASSSLRAAKPLSSTKSSMQKPTVMKFRRVMPPEPSAIPEAPQIPQPPQLPQPPSPPPLPPTPIAHQTPEVPEHILPASDDVVLSSPAREAIKLSPTQPPSPPQLVFVMEPIPPMSQLDAAQDILAEDLSPASGGRRTARPRKPMQVQFVNDVFNNNFSVPSNTIRPLQRRRTNVAQNLRPNPDDVFSGMSMTALKALTANNTIRNQHYVVAKLETEIVKKEGIRPESPAVKIKTIIQRQQEEKLKQREERAARRAKRYNNNDGDSDANRGEDENDDPRYESPSPIDGGPGAQWESPLAKHRKGAGDEEDYETPLKRYDAGADGKRRVKWDRGLFTEVPLDEVILGTRVPPKEQGTTKGCLALTAKTLQLDTLGNLVDAETPLLDLIQENVVVKKFVYDDDIETAEQPAAPVVRKTRSKSKKSKS